MVQFKLHYEYETRNQCKKIHSYKPTSLLTSALNQKVGKALFIQEVDRLNPYLTGNLGSPGYSSSVMVRGASTISSDSDIEFEKINLESTILVRFELK